MIFRTTHFAAIALICFHSFAEAEKPWVLEPDSSETLRLPVVQSGPPAAGKRVAITPREYTGSDVFHTLYLPPTWTQEGVRHPIIFEYTGNFFPASGSTGEPEDAALGYCLSGGRYIWVSLPYISRNHRDNEVTWWGDVEATVAYAKRNVPRIIEQFNADPDRVVLCGFSRGAIAVNFLGLHDDKIADLWTALATHDHFDGVREWKRTAWGTPLDRYRAAAAERLKRVRGRPYLVCQNGNIDATKSFLHSELDGVDNFTLLDINSGEILGAFPNAFAKSAHTDVWAIRPSQYRRAAWQWMNQHVAREDE